MSFLIVFDLTRKKKFFLVACVVGRTGKSSLFFVVKIGKNKRMATNKVVLVGRGGAGKDYLRQAFQQVGFTFHVSYTTRSPRPIEKDGKDYHFITEKQFDEMTRAGLWHEKMSFKGYQYGTTNEQFFSKEPSVFIMSPDGLKCLTVEERKSLFVVFLDPDSKILEQRLRQRGMSDDELQKRKKADQQFDDFEVGQPGMRVTDAWFNPTAIISQVNAKM